jgi:asparagine synthase (glutamine-hydrolysing)
MCGIAGFLTGEKPQFVARDLLQRMAGTIAHRGPDEQGWFHDGECGFAHTRLSIVDLAAGQQPMSNADGTIWVTFNGEIFNHVELRDELRRRGHVFRTDCDTEVILHLYEEVGPDCVEQFNGDFAFALWDGKRKQLMLARDRMGVRPLYYTERPEGLYFASEVKGLLEVEGVEAQLDPIALDQIFTFWFPLAPRTIFRGISELPPGHIMLATSQGTSLRRYWSLEYPTEAEGWDQRDEREIAEEVRALLLDATRIRLRADVPVGSYLSGGLDSAIVTAAAKKFSPDLRTFSITFDSEEFDESAFQQELVRELGTRHSAIACSPGDIARVFPDVIAHTERPLLRTGPAPLYSLAHLVHDSGYKVVLTGEGADEVFAGYDVFKEAKLRAFCARQPGSKRRPQLLRRLYPYLPGVQSQSQKYLEAFFAVDAASLRDPLFSHQARFKTTTGAKQFFSDDLRSTLKGYDALDELRERLPARFSKWHPLCQAQYLEAAYLLPGYILSSQGDRVSMAHAVEGRFPFLDHRVVACASRIPPHLKIRALREKHLLRESTKDWLPASIANRPKQPYRAPESRSFVEAGSPDYVANLFGAEAVRAANYFDAGAAQKLLRKCSQASATGQRENMAFVGILSTQLWHEKFTARSARSTTNIAA